MKKIIWISAVILALGTLACGSTMPLSTPEPTPTIEVSLSPEQGLSPPQNTVQKPASDPGPMPTVSAPSGLRVVYIIDGNLWSWTEAGGTIQLTATGDMFAARVSDNGQVLAFMRGSEVWTVGMDGMHARLLSTQKNEGGALWFSPDGSSIALSTQDHIDVVTLADDTTTTVVKYPALPDGYYPQVVWSPDALGFKTVIPSQTESGQAEMLFVFTSGTVASLAKFAMLPLSESLPHISPDGGYIIYAAKLGEEVQSLYLMDSSGATRPYGEPAEHIRAYGWLPDSKHFVYGNVTTSQAFLGSVDGVPAGLAVTFPPLVRWTDAEHFIALENGNLMLGDMSGASISIDSGVQNFDIVQ